MRRLLAFGLLAVLLAAAPVQAQQAPDADLRIDSVDQSDYPSVVITVTVPVEMNGLELAPENFFISEDGRGVGLDVERLPAEELSIALVVDTSGSMDGAPIAAAKGAVGGFIEALPPEVDMALLGFGSTSRLLVPFTSDPNEILSGMNSIGTGGETALYDALVEAAGAFPNDAGQRRTIVLLTDGGDTASEAELQDALVALIGLEARLVIIELESPESDRTTLNRLEASTGGALVAATDPEALQGIYSEVASDLINQYRLSFESFGQGSTEITAAVRTADQAAVGSTTVTFPLPPPVTPVTTTVTPTSTTAAPVTEVAAVPSDIDVPWLATTSGLMLGATAIFLALALILLLVVPSRTGAAKTLSSIADLTGRARRGRLSELTNKATLFAEDTLNRGSGEGWLRLRLDQAGLKLREGEFLLIVLAVALVVAFAGFLFGGWIWAAPLAIVVLLTGSAVLNWLGTRRANAFRAQLPEALQLISGSLRAGFGLNQAITAVAGELDSPGAEEFARAQLEVHLGREVEDALRSMAIRVQSDDLPWVAEAIEIHREIGGDVADLLDQIASTVRERERVRGQIQVLSAEGKVSGIVLVALPFVIAGLTFSVAPDYIGELTSTNAGKLLLAAGSGAMLIGIFWIRRIVRLEF